MSPYDAVCIMAKEMPDQRIPCVSTWYKHINANDIGVPYGSTPYHPDRRNRGGGLTEEINHTTVSSAQQDAQKHLHEIDSPCLQFTGTAQNNTTYLAKTEIGGINQLLRHSLRRTRKKFAVLPAGRVQSLPDLFSSMTGELQFCRFGVPMTAGVKSSCPSTTGAVVMTGLPRALNEMFMIASVPPASPSP